MAKLQIFLPEGPESSLELPEDITSVGRVPENVLQIEDDSVSSSHAQIFFKDGKFHVLDLGSTNGTFLNGEKIHESPLNSGDEVRFGSVATLFSIPVVVAEETPLPQEEPSVSAPSPSNRRPANFVSSSPIKRVNSDKDPRTLILLGAVFVGLGAFGAIIYLILQIQPPA
jgi:pSer/pThr/pTyr-binding forkhead associated (FHA) protein